MKEKYNIVAILKDKPQGTILYSPMFGECSFDHMTHSNGEIWVKYKDSLHVFDKYGRAYSDGECMLFPSNEMRDWSKFAWKKGDVLKHNTMGNHCIFSNWMNNNYTDFVGTYGGANCGDWKYETNGWSKETDESAIKNYIHKVEYTKGGKLNLETLEIEQPKQEFNPFDKVLVRNATDEIWHPRFFAYYVNDMAICMDESEYTYCIPYNDATANLAGTTNDYKGGKQ